MSENSTRGNCHRTPTQQYQNVVFAADRPHIGICRKCGKTFIRRYVDEDEYQEWWESFYGNGKSPTRSDHEKMPILGWTDWAGWSPTRAQYVIQELP